MGAAHLLFSCLQPGVQAEAGRDAPRPRASAPAEVLAAPCPCALQVMRGLLPDTGSQYEGEGALEGRLPTWREGTVQALSSQSLQRLCLALPDVGRDSEGLGCTPRSLWRCPTGTPAPSRPHLQRAAT